MSRTGYTTGVLDADDARLRESMSFEELDELDARIAEQNRETLSGLPARPGTIRR